MRISDWSSDVCSSDLWPNQAQAMIATSAATCTTNSAPGAGEPPPPNRIAAIKREPAISTRMLGGACPVRIQRHSFVAGIALIEAMPPRRQVKDGAKRPHSTRNTEEGRVREEDV